MKAAAVKPVLVQPPVFLSFSVGIAATLTAPCFLTNLLIVLILQQVGYAPALKITVQGNPVLLTEVPACILSQYRHYLIRGEHIVFSFHAAAVRILAAVKASL